MDFTIRVAKTKALISFAVTAKLICAFVFAKAFCWFSYAVAHISMTFHFLLIQEHKFASDERNVL